VSTLDDKRLRELLGDMAGETSAHGTVPSGLEKRVRRRVALNSAVVGTLVIAFGVGAFATVRAIAPAKTPTITPATSGSPGTTGPKPCSNGQLRAIGSISGAAGSRVGYIELRNYSATTCTLTGTPEIALYHGTQRISDKLIFERTVAQWQADAAPKPAGWPVVTVGKMGSTSDAARVRIGWSNWCQSFFPLWRVFIPGSGSVDVINGMDSAGAPPCNGPPLPSTVQVGPFEPPR
jgi:Protein of unknown function (DUF4232)